MPQPVTAPVPDIRAPQSNLIQPMLITGSSKIVGPESTAAVDYAAGQLTVVSDGAPLGFVLKLIAAKTGATVDMAPELQNERVAAHAGPGPVREVLTALLDSPRIDYIVLGTGDEPGSLQRIVLRKRQSFGQVALAAAQPRLPRQATANKEEDGLDENGQPVSNGLTPAEAQMSQQQRMENWKKARAEMLAAEMKQQAQDRENEKVSNPNAAIGNPYSPDPPPIPQDNPVPPADNPPQENPPQR